MKKQISFIYLLIAVVIAVGCYWLFGSKSISAPDINLKDIVTRDAIHPLNTTTLNADSFEALAQKSYGDLISINKSGSQLNIKINNANKFSGDFFNNNDKLLNYKRSQSGFDIDYDENNGTVNAIFTINDNAVNVPNDVIIMMMQKAYNR